MSSPMEPSTTPIALSFPVSRQPHLLFHSQIMVFAHCTMIHLTTSGLGDSASGTSPLGSFVYAMPDRVDPKNSISTALSTTAGSIEYATRLAKVLARRLNEPVYVGCSVTLEGVTVEEEMEGLAAVVGKVSEVFERERKK